MKKQQQQQWQVLQTPSSKGIGQKQQQIQQIKIMDSWLPRRQQLKTIQKQLKRFTFGDINFYVDKKLFDNENKKLVCLFHGTTTEELENFITEKQIIPKFFMTSDLHEAITYANDKKRRCKDKDVLPALLIFKVPEDVFKKLYKQNYNYFVAQTDADIDLLMKNSMVEMITIKPTQQKQKSKS